MYKVFIVDDERVIAEGLEKLIDWNGLSAKPAASHAARRLMERQSARFPI